MSTTLVRKAAQFLERRTDRRGFLRRSALASSAVAVAPSAYVLRPKTAYAAICNCSGSRCDCGALCCDGYTEFCCTLTGSNGCPPNTTYGGWWKADGSGYCDNGTPQPRYYLDCNAPCNGCGCGSRGVCAGSCSGTPCGCGAGSCNNRKAGCTGFRYGQCNQAVQCLGPIVCRVVTCTPPWALDPTCTKAVRTDNNTRFHNRPCLQADPGNPEGSVVDLQIAPGGIRVVGYVLQTAARTLRISSGATTLGETTANLSAADVGKSEPAGPPVAWFEAKFAVASGAQTICASIVDGAVIRRIGCRNFTVPYGSPIGAINAAVAVGSNKVNVRGWALDPNVRRPIGIHVFANGSYVGGGAANVDRPDVERDYPAFGARHGFDVTVEVPDGTQEVCVYAINRDAGANTQIGCQTLSITANTVTGVVESVGAAPGAVHVKGWAVDPTSSDQVRVRISVDGTAVATVVADDPRVDLDNLFGQAAHGFEVTVPVGAGEHQICVDGLPAGGGRAQRIGCATTSTGGSPVGGVDAIESRADRVVVRGWAVDPDTTLPAVMHFYVDGTFDSAVLADRERSDLPFGIRNGGFVGAMLLSPGPHEIKVFALDRVGGNRVTLLGVYSVDPRSGSPFGALQDVSANGSVLTVQGWAIDPDTTRAIGVHVYVDGVYAGGGRADRTRDNVGRRFPAYGPDHGFRFDLDLAPGQHEVCVYAIDKAGDHAPNVMGCTQVTI